MMSLTLLTAAAVATIAPYLAEAAKNAVGEVGGEAAKSVMDWMRAKLHGRAGEALEDLEKAPESEANKLVLQGQLLNALEAEPLLAEELTKLLEAAGSTIQRQDVSGDGAVGIQQSGSGNRADVRTGKAG